VVTVGASTTAMLGMMAGYGYADRTAANRPVLVAADQPTPAPSTTVAPRVIVVVVDGATGEPISPAAVSPAGGTVSGPPTTAADQPSVTTTTLAPVVAPQVVDVAVPVPPPPPPAPPAPAPQASTGGS